MSFIGNNQNLNSKDRGGNGDYGNTVVTKVTPW